MPRARPFLLHSRPVLRPRRPGRLLPVAVPAVGALAASLLLTALLAFPGNAQERFDYHPVTGTILQRGQQALTVCNGLFVSDRSLEEIYDGELARMGRDGPEPPSRVRVDRDRQAVSVGVPEDDRVPPMRAARREGLGCVVLGPGQDLGDLDDLPLLRMAPTPEDPDTLPWPDGDRVEDRPLPLEVDGPALEAAGAWAFDREGHGGAPSQVTLSLLVVHEGELLYERYAPGMDRRTRTRTWSAAKSIASTLIGIAIGEGLLELDEPLPFDWPPHELAEIQGRVERDFPMIPMEEWPPRGWEPAPDPRTGITLRNVLHMSSGLYPVDNDFASVIGSPLSYFAGTNSAHDARNRGLLRKPGTVWDYENHDTLLGVLALKTALEDEEAYLEFPRTALFDRIGMRSTVPGVDRFGNFVMSSQVYTNARDLARLGILHLNRGEWNGERILPEEWVDFVRTPAPSTEPFGNFYGGQWWLVPDARADLPQDAYTAAGAGGQYVIVVPSHDLVVVRRGFDRAGPGFPVWDLLGEVLKALPEGEGGEKPAPGDPTP